MPLRFKTLFAILVSTSIALPLNAAGPIPGSYCKKVGLTSIASGKKYTCIKSGNKLVWNKGSVIKPTPNPISSTSASSPQNLLSVDGRITPNSDLSKIEKCKTVDNTPDYTDMGVYFRNGFPRPLQSSSGNKSAKVLVIPISFEDLPFTIEKSQQRPLVSSDIDLLNEVKPKIEEAFSTLSGGRFSLTLDILPKSQWWEFKSKHPFISRWGVSNFEPIFKLIESEKSEYVFDGYDAYIFLGGNSAGGGLNNGEAIFAQKIKNSKSGYINAVLIAGGFSNPILWVHELGHALFAFEDLYLFKPNDALSGAKEINVPAGWDLMANSSRNVTFLEWNRLLMGWLKDSEVRCISDQTQSIHYLSEFKNNDDPKLLAINLAEGVTLAAEPRNTTKGKGLLLYTINTYTPHGEGPIIAQNKLLEKGDQKTIYGWEFRILDTNSEGVLFSAEKTDVNKFVPPKVKPAGPSGPIPTTKIKVTSTNVASSSSLQAKATLKATGQLSYRVFVTALDDFQKVYFESGYVNDSGSEISLYLTGLTCDRKLRAVIEFYTEKDGKGERVVVQHNELDKISC